MWKKLKNTKKLGLAETFFKELETVSKHVLLVLQDFLLVENASLLEEILCLIEMA